MRWRPFGVSARGAVPGFIVFVLVGCGNLLGVRPAFAQSGTAGESCRQNLRVIGDAVERYSSDHAGRFPLTLAELSPDYLASIPTCPSASTDTYTRSYVSATEPDAYAFYCAGHNHRQDGYLPNRPSYDSMHGVLDHQDALTAEQCAVSMRYTADALKRYKSTHQGRLPAALRELNDRKVGWGDPQYYTANQEFTLMCNGAVHTHEGVAPLYPRIGSKSPLEIRRIADTFTPSTKPTGGVETRFTPEPAAPPLRSIVAAVTLVFVLLALGAWMARRGAFKQVGGQDPGGPPSE